MVNDSMVNEFMCFVFNNDMSLSEYNALIEAHKTQQPTLFDDLKLHIESEIIKGKSFEQIKEESKKIANCSLSLAGL